VIHGAVGVIRAFRIVSVCIAVTATAPQIASCFAQNLADISPIAVSPFENLGGSSALPWMAEAIADSVCTKLSKAEGVTIVERAHIGAAMDELALALQGFVDESTAAKVGKFTGARGIVVGNYIATEDGFLRITARLVSVESGEVVFSHQVTGEIRDAGDIFRLIDQIALETLAAMGHELTEEEKEGILEVPTRSIEALEAKTLAGIALAKGEEAQALEFLEKAIQEDPGYREARDLAGQILNMQGRWFFESSVHSVSTQFSTPWNPASLVDVQGLGVVLLTSGDWIAASQSYAIGVVGQLPGMRFGVTYVSSALADLPLFDEWGNPIGYMAATDDAIALSVPIRLSGSLSVGATVKWTRSRWLGDSVNAEASMMSADIGVAFQNGTVAAALLGKDVPRGVKRWDNGYEEVFAPILEGLVRWKAAPWLFLHGEAAYGLAGGSVARTADGFRFAASLLVVPLERIGIKAGLTTEGYVIGGMLGLGHMSLGLDLHMVSDLGTRLYAYVNFSF